MEEIKQKTNDGFIPIPTGETQPAPQRGGQRNDGGFRQRRPGFGRAGVGRDRPKDEFQTKLLDLARVTRVTGGGKRMSFRAIVVAGDKKGKIGIGIDKGKMFPKQLKKPPGAPKEN
ncbi:MAG: hypothetical protein NTY81_03590 [Candidatus Staskawiczbacteria bacterium]|nr:hypothetical protein [Candidatus Staskawiczbacteria bacterium]